MEDHEEDREQGQCGGSQQGRATGGARASGAVPASRGARWPMSGAGEQGRTGH